MKNKERGAGITITMTFVLFIIIAMLLVTLEHAYVYAGRSIAFQSMNKALESVIGMYYAPLYSQYGLLAVPVGEDFFYEDLGGVSDEIITLFNKVGAPPTSPKKEGFLWNQECTDCEITAAGTMMDNQGEAFKNQIMDDALYETIEFLADELADMDIKGLREVLDFLDDSEVDVKEAIEDLLDDKDEEEDREKKLAIEDLYNTLKLLLTDGFSGLWFEDIDDLSERKISGKGLPSYNYYGVNVTSTLYSAFDLTEVDIDDGNYISKVADAGFFKKFINAVEEGAKGTGEKAVLTAYASTNFDNFARDEINGKLRYEQEYLIFGNLKDDANVKDAAWSIFGIRLIMSLAFILTDTGTQDFIAAILELLGATNIVSAIIYVLYIVAYAVECAIVETAAILRGKAVDFLANSESICIKSWDVLYFTKDNIDSKAEDYEASGLVKFGYQFYISVFLLMTGTDILSFRMMDLIQTNMQWMYDSDFKIENCYIAFAVDAKVSMGSRYASVPIVNRGSSISYDIETLITMP